MRAGWWCIAVLLGSGCGRCGTPTASPDARPDAAEVPDATAFDASAVDATADASEASAAQADAGCSPTLLQRDVCAPTHADLDLDNDAIHAWFTVRGATMKEYTFERCREVVFGPSAEHVLVCIDMTPTAIDPILAIAGPVEHRYDLVVATARGDRRVELLRLPFAFGMNSTGYNSGPELLFSARYTVDATAGTLELVASPEECAAATEMLKPYWYDQIAELRANNGIPQGFRWQLIHADELERVSDAERIAATCRARGHYVRGRDGRLVKAAK